MIRSRRNLQRRELEPETTIHARFICRKLTQISAIDKAIYR